MEFFDSHSHLNDEKFDKDKDETINMLKKEKITRFITCGYDLESSKKAINIAQKYDCTFATCAISPNDIPQSEEELWKELEEIKKIAKQKKVVAIGEIGLDYYWNKDNKELQKKAFIKQIEIANDLNLPIAIHTRDAVMDTLAILKQNNVNNKGIFHCCPLAPEPVRGTKNTPANVKYVAKKIAEVKKMKLEEIANITYENANNVYKIKK